MRPAVPRSPTLPPLRMTTTTTRPPVRLPVLRRATLPPLPLSTRLLTLLPMPTEPHPLMSMEPPPRRPPAPALEITTTMMAPPLLRSLTAPRLRKLTVPQPKPTTLTELPPPMKRRRLWRLWRPDDADVADSLLAGDLPPGGPLPEDQNPGGQPLLPGGQPPTGDQLPSPPVLAGS